MGLLKRLVAAGCLVALSASGSLAAEAATDNLSEQEVKAALIFKFGMFIEWPASAFASPAAPIEFCVVGADGLADALTWTVDRKTVGGRQVSVRRRSIEADLRTCHMVFVGGVQPKPMARMLEQLREAPVLLIGETPRFAQVGGIVNFVIAANRVRFEINPGAAERHGLRVSSKLLSLAVLVRDSGPGTS